MTVNSIVAVLTAKTFSSLMNPKSDIQNSHSSQPDYIATDLAAAVAWICEQLGKL